MTRKRQRAFTLIELLVAVVVFAVFGLMAYGGLSAVIRQNEVARTATDRLQDIQYTMRQLVLDISQLNPRPIRDQLGSGRLGALLAGAGAEFPLELTRGGWRNPMSLPRPTLQRVAYFIEDDHLVRLQWLVLDRTLANEPLRVDLADRVIDLRVRFMDASGEWQDAWPPAAGGGADLPERTLPLGVEIEIEFEDYGSLRRVIEVAG